jgi:hypothetical protein
MSEETQAERDRCTAIVDYAIAEAGAEAVRWLTRVRNQIANGMPPQTIRQQMVDDSPAGEPDTPAA